MVDGQLAGDDGGLVGGPVVNDFHQIRLGQAVDARHAPVVEQQHIRLGQLQQPVAEGAVAMVNAQLFTQPWYPRVSSIAHRPNAIKGIKFEQSTWGRSLYGLSLPSSV